MKKLIPVLLCTLALVLLTTCSLQFVKPGEIPAHFAEAPFKCSDAAVLYNVTNVDREPLIHYIDYACELVPEGKELLRGNKIDIHAMNMGAVVALCSVPGTTSQGCTVPTSDTTYVVVVPHGSPGIVTHEVIHAIMFAQGMNAKLHHPFMLKQGWYWIDPKEAP